MNAQLNIDMPEFWEQVRLDLSRLIPWQGALCNSPTFASFWENSQEFKDELKKLAQEFLNDKQGSTYSNLFRVFKGSWLLFIHKTSAGANWREEVKLIRWNFIEWNLKRTQTLTTLAQ